MAGDIVLGYDHSECAQSALEEAIELARELGSRLVIAYGYEPPERLIGDEQAAHRRALEEVGDRVTQTALRQAVAAGVPAEVVLRADRPVNALLSLAAEQDARMIVVGSYGESPLRGAILGSIPHKLLHLSERPVLVVPAG